MSIQKITFFEFGIFNTFPLHNYRLICSYKTAIFTHNADALGLLNLKTCAALYQNKTRVVYTNTQNVIWKTIYPV